MKQITFDGKLVDSTPHPDDLVYCSDGVRMMRKETFVDYHGVNHSTEEHRKSSNMDIVHKVIEDIAVGIEENTTHEDYALEYIPIFQESYFQWKAIIDDWLSFNLDIDNDTLLDAVCHRISIEGLWEFEYNPNEFSAYNGKDILLDSFDVGTPEEEIDITRVPELKAAYEEGVLEKYLDTYNGVGILPRHWSYKSGELKQTGFVDGKFITLCLTPGGQWHIVISASVLSRLVIKEVK